MGIIDKALRNPIKWQFSLKKIRLNLRPAALCLLPLHRQPNFLLSNLLKSRYKTRVNSCSARILNKYVWENALANMELGNPSRTLQFMQIMLNPLPSYVLILVIYVVFCYFPHTRNELRLEHIQPEVLIIPIIPFNKYYHHKISLNFCIRNNLTIPKICNELQNLSPNIASYNDNNRKSGNKTLLPGKNFSPCNPFKIIP